MQITAAHKKVVTQALFPCAVLLMAALVITRWTLLPIADSGVRDFFSIVGFGFASLLALRFRSSRMLIGVAVLLVAQIALVHVSAPLRPATASVLAVFLPLNFLVISIWPERGLTAHALAFGGWLVLVQLALGAVLVNDRSGVLQFVAASPLDTKWLQWSPLPQFSVVFFVAAILFAAVLYALNREALDVGIFWASVTAFVGLHGGSVGATSFFLTTAALILAASLVERSYSMAYLDELTGLPGRRAFNELADRLEGEYTIAVVDVDHFKRFNDTYGHETGDQVLRMVAGRLAEAGGGGKAFRCGGEEFAVVFAGLTPRVAAAHAEALRARIEISLFTLRGTNRRQSTRGTPDRRKVHAQVPSLRDAGTPVSVTVSIGCAGPGPGCWDFEAVYGAADRALYRAKDLGRNRVELAPERARRVAPAVSPA